MGVKKIDHVNIRTRCFDETIAFYRDVVLLDPRPTPEGNMSKGAWLYDDGGNAAIHLGRADVAYPADELLGRFDDSSHGTGSVDHVALECTGEAQFRERVEGGGHAFKVNDVPQIGLRQVFVRDPNGVLLELNFRGD